MGKGYKHGASGGASLNFNVKIYPSETELKADKPRDNTIGVITTTTMTSWVFSATEPTEPEVGMVWISVGNSSGAEFNALKNNTLKVYPLKAQQYEGGAFVDKTAFSYKDENWVDWIPQGALYWLGDEYTDITGGWIAKAVDWDSKTGTGPVAPTVVREANKLVMSQIETGCGVVMTANKIDLSGYKTLRFKGKFYASGDSANTPLFATLRLFSNIGTYVSENVVAQLDNNKNPEVAEYSLSLEGLSTTSVYVAFTLVYSNPQVELEKLWLEK